jgi:hypothetical protein
MGGWIINGEKKYFCHDGRDGSCFDNYCNKNEDVLMPGKGKKKYTAKQMKIARIAVPRNAITAADFAALRKGKKNNAKRKA